MLKNSLALFKKSWNYFRQAEKSFEDWQNLQCCFICRIFGIFINDEQFLEAIELCFQVQSKLDLH